VSTEKVTTAQAVAWARAHGAVPHVLDGSEARTKAEVLDAIGEALEFPPYYGGNLDALFDCLADLSWLPEGEHVLVWSHHQSLAEEDWQAYQRVRSVLKDGAGSANGRRLTVVFAAS